MEGRYLTYEKRFEDKGYVFEHYLFVQGEEGIKQYKLDSQNIPDNFLKISGSDVTITGTLTPKSSANLGNQYNEDIKVSEFTVADQESSQRSLQREQPASMTSVTLLSIYNDSVDGFHDQEYFTERHYDLGTDSMAKYWDTHSYGKFTWGGAVHDWTTVNSLFDPTNPNEDPQAAQDAVTAFDPVVNFNNVDQIIVVWDFCPNPRFASAWTGTQPFTTDEGLKDLLLVHTYDCDDGFPTGINFERGYGVQAHEVAHTFGLNHVQQIPDDTNSGGAPYLDEHALLSGGGSFGPPGFLTYHKMDVGWIDPADIVTVPNGVQQEITLDFANMDSGTANFLMALVPFGGSGHKYTVEARIDGTFDSVVGGGPGIWIYHYSPTGHPGAVETFPPLLLVPTEPGVIDPLDPKPAFDAAGLDPGDSFTENGVTFEYLSDTPTSITIRITNNACAPPGPGDWIPPASCQMVGNATVTGNLILQNGRVLTIPDGVVLTVNGYILVEFLSGIYIVSGGGLLWSPP